MTAVVEPPPSPAAAQKSLLDHPHVATGLLDNVRRLDSRRGDTAPQSAGGDAARPEALEVKEDASATSAQHEGLGVRFLSRIQAWMVVPVVDFALMVAPLAWRPPQIYATVTMAVLATLLLTGGRRYVARLHLSVLD